MFIIAVSALLTMQWVWSFDRRTPPSPRGLMSSAYSVSGEMQRNYDQSRVSDIADATFLAFQEYTVLSGPVMSRVRAVENKENLPWSAYVGVCGMPGRYHPAVRSTITLISI